MAQYQVEALRTIRTLQAQHETAGHTFFAEQMRKVGDQVEAMAEQLHTMATALRAKDADYAALKEAARDMLFAESQLKDCWTSERQRVFDSSHTQLTTLVGENLLENES